MYRCLLGFLLGLMMVLPVFGADDSIKISEIVITSKIVKGKPIDSIKRLSATTEKNLYCFTRTIAPAGTDSQIKHIWYKGDEQVGEFTLSVKGERWRTYSKKNIQKGWSGDWRVEVVAADGTLLKIVRFRMN
jgi:membrane-bound ClpP family serine protease